MLLFSLACVAAAELGYRLTITLGTTPYPIVWAPLGVLVAAFLTTEPKQWLSRSAITAAAILISGIAIHGHDWRLELIVCLLTVITAALTAVAVRRAIPQPFSIARVTDVWALAVTAVAVPMATAGAIAALPPAWIGTSPLFAWRAAAAAGSIGLLLVAPCVIGLAQGQTTFSRATPWSQRLEPLVAMAAAIVLMVAVFGDFVPIELRVPAYVLPVLLWNAFRTKPGDAATTILAVVLIAAWESAAGRGPFTLISPAVGINSWVLRVQGAGIAFTTSMMLLAAVVAERKRAAAERDRLVEELQQVLAEIKTLQGLIPLCAWCHKIRDDAGAWQGLESYLQQHTDATFSHGICPACISRVEIESTPGGDSAEA